MQDRIAGITFVLAAACVLAGSSFAAMGNGPYVREYIVIHRDCLS